MKYTLMEKHLRANHSEISCAIKCEHDDHATIIERAAQLAAGLQYREDLEDDVAEVFYTIVEDTPVGVNEKTIAECYIDSDVTYLHVGGLTFKLI